MIITDNGKGLCEGGAKKSETYYKHEPEQKPFRFSNLQKNKKRNGFLRLKVQKSSTQGIFTPAFAKPHDV